jgi:hypothetical protein
MPAQQSILIDEQGKLWDAASWQLRKSLYLNDVEGDVAAPLINNLGFVGVTSRANSAIVRFNPKSVSRAAIGALYYLLSSRSCTRLGLTFALNGEAQRHEIFGSPRAALLRIEALLDQEHRLSWRPLYASRAGKLSALSRRSALGVLLELWRETSGTFVDSTYLPLLKQFAADRYVQFEPRAEGGFNIPRAGSGLQIPDEPRRALGGSRLEDIADKDYADWAAHFYTTVVESRQPRYDHLRAYINWPRAGRVERKYSRMILPCRTPCGRTLLLGVSGALAEKRLLADPL